MMKHFLTLMTAAFLVACHSNQFSENYTKCREAWSSEALAQLPMLPVWVDGTLQTISPDTLVQTTPSSDTVYAMPADAVDVMFLQLAPTPGFRIGAIRQIESDDDRLFIRGTEIEPLTNKILSDACFIFCRDGSLVARLENSSSRPVCMAVNRQTREVCVVFSDDSPMSTLLYYDYEGRLLRRCSIDYMYASDAICFSQNHLFCTTRPSRIVSEAEGLPQLTVCDPSGLPRAFFALSRPFHDEWYGYPNASLASCGDEAFYATSYSDTIWQLMPEGAVARYLVRNEGVGIGSQPFDGDSTLTWDDHMLATENLLVPTYAANLSDHLLVSPGFIVKNYMQCSIIRVEEKKSGHLMGEHQINMFTLVVDRTTGHSQWVVPRSTRPSVTPFIGWTRLLLTSDDMLVSYSTPADLKYYAAHNDLYKMTDELLSLASRINLEANPVLLLMPLKHF